MSRSVSQGSTVVAVNGLLSTDVDGELVMLSTTTNLYYGLNTSGKRIWELIETPRSVTEIRDRLVDELEVEPDACERDVIALLQDLVDEGLAEIQG